MPITNNLQGLCDEYDVIVVGGGSAGCVLAGKLSEATRQEGLSILLIESGPNSLNDPKLVRPGNYWSNLDPDSGYFDFIKAKLDHCGGREVAVAVPNILGGGGSLNFMMYTRASASDYDDWKTEGWDAKDLVPFLRKLENYQNQLDPTPDKNIHGFSGPFVISQGPMNGVEQHGVATEVHHAAQSLGYPIIRDMQDLKQGCGFANWAKWIDPVTGHRQDPAHRYIHPNTSDHKTGLTVLCEHKGVRVIIKDGRATGIEVVPTAITKLDLPSQGLQGQCSLNGADANPNVLSTDSTPRMVRARKMVVLSAGTTNTPAILERSGIGAPEVLRKAGVDCVADLPGVGENFQDHLGCSYFYRFDKDTFPHSNEYLNGDPAAVLKADEDWKKGKGHHTMNFIPSAAKIRPNEEELKEMGPEFCKLWDEYYRDAPDKPLFAIAAIERPINLALCPYLTPDYAYFVFIPYMLYPISRGSIHITHPSMTSLPDFAPGYLSDPRDLPPTVFAYKLQRELARRMPSFRGEVKQLHPRFSETSAARCVEYPTKEQRELMSREKVVYTEEDNKVIEESIKNNFLAVWHWLGTTAMRKREEGGVVDGRLGVYGVEGLKVADLSICPGNVGANTYSTALMVGSKAAEIVAEDLGLRVPENWIEKAVGGKV